jgi:hypothetical protein
MCIRYCDAQLDVNEVSTTFHEKEHLDVATLFMIAKGILLRFNMDVKLCKWQRFDGAANMAGLLNGLQAKIGEIL